MTGIPGVNIPDTIVPFDTNDTTATHDEKYGKGGWRSVTNLSTRDAIPSTRRVVGMPVFVENLNTTYQLLGGISNSNWQIFSTTGGTSGGSLSTLSDVVITNLLPGQTLVTDGEKWYNVSGGVPITGSSERYQGSFELDTLSQLYTIFHPELPSISAGNPIISLQIPTTNDNLFTVAILNRNYSSFDVVLSQIPDVSGYYINWNLGLTGGTTIIGSNQTSKAPTQETVDRILSINDNNAVLHCTNLLYNFTVPFGLPAGFTTMFSNDSGTINISGDLGVVITDIRVASNPPPNIAVLIQDDVDTYKLAGGKA